MQQTEKRNLNIIEPSDPFLPDALNENTRKIEAALEAHEDAVAAQVDALDQRIQVIEAKKFVYGSFYVPDPNRHHVSLGFTPKLVYIYWAHFPGTISCMIAEGLYSPGETLTITEEGFDYFINDYNYLGQYMYYAVG